MERISGKRCPRTVLLLRELFGRNGEMLYPVGGCVRDTLMGVSPHDWDAAVTSRPERTMEICRVAGLSVIPTGIRHGTVTVRVPSSGGRTESIECTTCRTDGKYSDSRHPDEVTFTGRIEDDLSRRDFTVNAMAFVLPGGEGEDMFLLDPFGGRADLQARVIRCVGNPDERFAEDALRMLRAVRFAARLHFSIDPETVSAVRRSAFRLSRVSRERVASELRGILTGEAAVGGVRLLSETGLWPYLFPLPVPFPERWSGTEGLSGRFPVRLSALLWEADDTAVSGALQSLRLSREETEETVRLLGGRGQNPPVTPYAARCLRRDFGSSAEDLLSLRRVFAPHPSGTEEDRELLTLVRRSAANGDAVTVAELSLNGRDLQSLGIPAGKDIGETLAFLLDVVLQNPEENTKERLTKRVRERKKTDSCKKM